MTDRKQALQDLLAKYENAYAKLPDACAMFSGVDGPRAARLSFEASIEQILGDLNDLIAQEATPE